MYCKKCGKNIPPWSKFCRGCGNRARSSVRLFYLGLTIAMLTGAMFIMYLRLGDSVWRTVCGGTALVLLTVILGMFITKTILSLRRHPISGSFLLLFLLAVFGFVVWIIFIQINPPMSIKAAIVKGPISDASVSLYELKDNGEKGRLMEGPKKSYTTGEVYFLYLWNLPKRLLIESKGGSYQDEATGQTVFLKDTDILTAILPAGTKAVAVTPFTTIAAALAKAKIQAGIKPDEAMISANEAVAKQYGLTSILDIPAEGDAYSNLLAGFSQLAKNLDVPPGELISALAKDWSDGKADGKQNNQAVSTEGGKKIGTASTTGIANATNQIIKFRGTPGSKEATVIVNPPATQTTPPAPKPEGFTITTKSLPAWVSGQPGSFTITAEGGSLPLRWSVKSGSLPTGFTLSQDGILSGSYILPSGVNKKVFAPFAVEVKDQKGETKSVQLSVTVVPAAPQITTTDPPTLTVNRPYEGVIATASGGLPPYTFQREASSGPMPMGMQISFSGNNALLTGSPQAKGSFYFRVCVIDRVKTEKCGDVSFAVEEEEKPQTLTETWKWDGDYLKISENCECNNNSCSYHKVGNLDRKFYRVFENQTGRTSLSLTRLPIGENGYAEATDVSHYDDRDKTYSVKFQFTESGNTKKMSAVWTYQVIYNKNAWGIPGYYDSSDDYICTETFTGATAANESN